MNVYIFCNADFFNFEEGKELNIEGFDFRRGDSLGTIKSLMPNEEMWTYLGGAVLERITNTPYFFKAAPMIPGGGTRETASSLSFLQHMFDFLW